MRIQNLRSEQCLRGRRIAATMTWEDCDRSFKGVRDTSAEQADWIMTQ